MAYFDFGTNPPAAGPVRLLHGIGWSGEVLAHGDVAALPQTILGTMIIGEDYERAAELEECGWIHGLPGREHRCQLAKASAPLCSLGNSLFRCHVARIRQA